ncbi:D,D-heptose 1,7-bisphosphate phosphatase [Bacillus sp. OxB-1]|nr:D,D-heptose 1,7-bisphosphate phosphatase [Bacillus sp. OxB-1]
MYGGWKQIHPELRKEAGTIGAYLGASDPLADAVFPDLASPVEGFIEDSAR